MRECRAGRASQPASLQITEMRFHVTITVPADLFMTMDHIYFSGNP